MEDYLELVNFLSKSISNLSKAISYNAASLSIQAEALAQLRIENAELKQRIENLENYKISLN